MWRRRRNTPFWALDPAVQKLGNVGYRFPPADNFIPNFIKFFTALAVRKRSTGHNACVARRITRSCVPGAVQGPCEVLRVLVRGGAQCLFPARRPR